MAKNLTRSSSGFLGSNASSSTRRLNCNHDRWRLKNRLGLSREVRFIKTPRPVRLLHLCYGQVTFVRPATGIGHKPIPTVLPRSFAEVPHAQAIAAHSC